MRSSDRRVHLATAGDVRRRLGNERGDRLLLDALKGGRASRLVLEKALDAETLVDDDHPFLLIGCRSGPQWWGRRLSLDRHLPHAIRARMIGRRLGDVVSGTGADELVVEASQDGPQGTEIRVEARWQTASDLHVDRITRLSGPPRRALHHAVHEWRDMANGYGGPKDGFVDTLRLTMAALIPLVLVAAAIVSGFRGDGARMALFLSPFVAYVATGMGTGLWRDAPRRRDAR